jgi:hypothetical protein
MSPVLLLSLDFSLLVFRFASLDSIPRGSYHQSVSVISVLSLSILFLSLSRIPPSSLVASSTHSVIFITISRLSSLSPLILSFRLNLLARHCHFHLDLFPAFSGFFPRSLIVEIFVLAVYLPNCFLLTDRHRTLSLAAI